VLRLVDIAEHDDTHLRFETEEISSEDMAAYVMYDTSTGISDMNDYYSWRTITTTTGDEDIFALEIDNTNKYPSVEDDISDYSIFNRKLFKVMTWAEHEVIQMLLTRIDLVRRRLPNPGVTISNTDNIGMDGVVSFAGGWDKKFSLEELRQMIDGSLIELNVHPPTTERWWQFTSNNVDKTYNPYSRTPGASGVIYEMIDTLVLGALIRCLHAWGILEIDINFSTSDSGLTITYDRVGQIASWMQNLLNDYQERKYYVKMNSINSFGVGVGSYPFAAMGWVGTAMNQVSQSGITPLSSMLGFGLRGNVPL
jgi:hypothetical protein